MFLNRLSALLRLSAVRQTLLLLTLFSGISLIAWGSTFLLVQHEMRRGVDSRLALRMEAAIAALDAGQPLPAPDVGETITRLEHPRREGFTTRDAPGSETEMRYLVRRTSHGHLQVGEDTELQEELQEILAAGMSLSLMATLFLTGGAGLWMARRSQARLNTINAGLAAVARGELSTRLVLAGGDDLSLLADRINATTARLDDAMEQMRVQSSNIAHDLRTPLARLRAQLEGSLMEAVAQDRPVHPEDLSTALEQVDRITGTFDALLRLARLERGVGREAFATVRLEDLATAVTETFGPVVEHAGQTLQVEITQPGRIRGDQDLLVQLVANLLQNAMRHGAAGQTIRLRIHGPRLSVSDEGPGIPIEERANVFQPLYQGEATRQGEGFGLGLSLVRAIAELHEAALTLSDGPNGRGLRVTLQFPGMTEL